MTEERPDQRPSIYLPSLPPLSSDDLAHYHMQNNARVDLVTQLSSRGMFVKNIGGLDAWLKNMVTVAKECDGFLFPPMTSLEKSHPRYQAEAAKRWFEFFSLVTGVHVGSKEKFLNGVSKPCVVMDPDGQWELAVDLLKDLRNKGMFTSNVDEIVQVVKPDPARPDDFHSLNARAIEKLDDLLRKKHGKTQREVQYRYGEDYIFDGFKKEVNRHPFGIAVFGSATTRDESYIEATKAVARAAAERGWRMMTGAGIEGCMGAADQGFEEGRQRFKAAHPDSHYTPAHVGVSTQAILRLEGPPEHIDQLIITEDIYDRMKVMIKGNKPKSTDPKDPRRLKDTTKVIFVAPGGTGTLHEFATMMQLATNGDMMSGRQVVLLDFPVPGTEPPEGFWDKLQSTAFKLGFEDRFKVAHSPEEAMQIADKIYEEWLERHPEEHELHAQWQQRQGSPGGLLHTPLSEIRQGGAKADTGTPNG